jgi:peptidoglycan/LPS O-acetylase OafA/YrhL
MPEAKMAVQRRYDLDALRAFAMLLGIALHGALSFVPGAGIFWGVQDVEANSGFAILLNSIHGWRMPLFFLVSGFFTMMLWKKRGMAALLKQRSLRILLPLVIGMFTIVPLNLFVGWYVRAQTENEETWTPVVAKPVEVPQGIAAEEERVDVFRAVVFSDLEAIETYRLQGGDLNAKDPFGSTPLHVACLFGRGEVALWLMKSGADLDARNNEGQTPETMLQLDWGTTSYIAKQFSIPLEQKMLYEERLRIAESLKEEFGRDVEVAGGGDSAQDLLSGVIFLLFYMPVWHHLWFLYFLCWFVVGFALVVLLAKGLGIPNMGRGWVVGWGRYLWLVPMTALPQFFMGWEATSFGPDTSIGLLPLPSVFFYYAIFFGYGAVYYSADDGEMRVGRHGWLKCLLALVVLLPLGLYLQNPQGLMDRAVFSAVQVVFAWMMIFGLLGLFHRWLSAERPWVRYLSDGSYWMYLVHVPLVILVQFWVSSWEMPALIKFGVVIGVTVSILVASYQLLVRWTYIGLLLNGRMYPWHVRSRLSMNPAER